MRPLLGIALLFAALGARAGDSPWNLLPLRLTAEQRNAVIRGRTVRGLLPVEGASLHAGYAVAVVRIPAPRVVRAITDYDAYDEDYMPYVVEARVVRRENGRALRYERVDPLVLDARYYEVWTEDPVTTTDGGVARTTITWKYNKGSGNIVDTKGSWTVVALADGRSLMCYHVAADINSVVPAFVQNLATRFALPGVLRAVQKRAQRY